MKTYRRTAREHALAAAERAVFRLARLSTFRKIEGAELGVRDELEGSVLAPVPAMTVVGGTKEAQRLDWLFAMAPGATVVFGGGNKLLRTTPDYWVLCLSDNADAQLPGDTLMEIASAHRLAEALQRAHPDRLGEFRVAKVRYERRVFDIRVEDVPEPDPFVKPDDDIFVGQSEVRICWIPRDDDLAPFVTESAEAAQLVSLLE